MLLENGDVLSLEHPHGVRMGWLLFSFSFVINGYGLEHRGSCFGLFLHRLFYCAGVLSILVFVANWPCKKKKKVQVEHRISMSRRVCTGKRNAALDSLCFACILPGLEIGMGMSSIERSEEKDRLLSLGAGMEV